MPKYIRNTPIIVEATQWFKHGDHPKVEKITDPIICNKPEVGLLKQYYTADLVARSFVYPGDYIVELESGLEVCSKEYFEELYKFYENNSESPKNVL